MKELKGEITEVSINGVTFPCPTDDGIVSFDSVTKPESSRRMEVNVWLDEKDEFEYLVQSQKNGILIKHTLSDDSIIETPFLRVEKVPNDPGKASIVVDCRDLSDDEFFKLQQAYWGYGANWVYGAER